MTYRTDLTYQNGKLSVNPASQPGADIRKPLPEVKGSDLLLSDKYGESWKKEAGDLGNDGALDSLANAQASISKAFKAFQQIRERKAPEVTQAAHLKSVTADFDRSVKSLAERADRAQSAARSRLESIESQFREAVKWNTQDAQELRAVLRGMKPEERGKAIGGAIEAGDGQLLAAVLGAHPTLSGLSADMQKGLRKQAMQRHAPQLLKLEQAISKAKDSTHKAFIELLDRSDAITAKTVRDQYDAEARAASEARKAAEATGF